MSRLMIGAIAGVGLVVLAVASLLNALDPETLVAGQRQKNDDLIAEQMAYHLGVVAYLYGYPLVDMHRRMHNQTHRSSRQQPLYVPVNRMHCHRDLPTPETAGNLRAPVTDMLGCTGWFDISEEPLVIHTPDTSGRYFSIAVTNQYAEVKHIGRRTTGAHEQYLALVPPDWRGRLPDGVEAFPVETDKGWLRGRIRVDGPEDLAAARALADEIWLASLGEFRPGRRPALPAEKRGEPIDPMGSLEFFRILNRALEALPQRASEAALIAQFGAIGIGPQRNFEPASLAEPARRGLERALEDAGEIVRAATARSIPAHNGWMMPQDVGRYGHQYMQRAAVVRGGYGDLPEESLQSTAFYDAEGELLSGSRVHRLHFAAGQEPPVDASWSLSVYDLRGARLVPNEIDRYSIGDRTPGLVRDGDGSLTLWLQHQNPGPGKNWIPTPVGKFFAVMRLYEPSRAALDDTYRLPAIATHR